jgi:anti-sigma factor RsiW
MSRAAGHLGERLQDMAGHRLSGTELEAANDHLAACERCSRELEILLRVKQALAPKVADDAMPAELRATVLQMLDRERIAAEPSIARRFLATARSRWMLGVAIGVLVAIALVVWVFSATGG